MWLVTDCGLILSKILDYRAKTYSFPVNRDLPRNVFLLELSIESRLFTRWKRTDRLERILRLKSAWRS